MCEKVAERLPENKRKSYRQRLTSSLALKDYSAFLDILAQLSNYTDIQFDFVYDLFENFEDNKELAYTFANAMTKKVKCRISKREVRRMNKKALTITIVANIDI